MVLRYSATHRVEHNKVHRLDALDAYNQKLVKKIAVRGITVQGLAGADGLPLPGRDRDRRRAPSPGRASSSRCRPAAGIKRQVKRLDPGADLHDVSGGIEAYQGLRHRGHRRRPRRRSSSAAATSIAVGQVTADVTEDAKRRIQIREVIRAHLDKERELFAQGIKVLSLFFIDEVAKYRDYRRADTHGDYARVFEEEYPGRSTTWLARTGRRRTAGVRRLPRGASPSTRRTRDTSRSTRRPNATGRRRRREDRR